MNLQNEMAPSLSDGITRSQNDSFCLQACEHIILDDAYVVKEVVLNENIELFRMEQPQRKSHWDFVLEEMEWMANDFMQERIWKMNVAAHISCLVDFVRRQSNFQEQTQETTMPTKICFQTPQRKRKLEFQESLYYIVPYHAMEAYRNFASRDHERMLQGETNAFVGSPLVNTQMSGVHDILHVQFIPKRPPNSTMEVGQHIACHSDARMRNPSWNIQAPPVTRNGFLNCGFVDVDLIPKRPRSSAVAARQHVAGLHVISQPLALIICL